MTKHSPAALEMARDIIFSKELAQCGDSDEAAKVVASIIDAGLQAQLSTVLQREAETIARYDAKLNAEQDGADALRQRIAELEAAEPRAAAMRAALEAAQDWANRIAGDERVCGWVHQNDYGLYYLLADCPVDFDKALSTVAPATDYRALAKELKNKLEYAYRCVLYGFEHHVFDFSVLRKDADEYMARKETFVESADGLLAEGE